MKNTEIAHSLSNYLISQEELCDRLEQLADNLPHDIDPQECLLLAKSIVSTLKISHNFEETILFPALREQNKTQHFVASLTRLQFEHWEDESFAEELRQVLIDFAASPDATRVGAISYMLRGFFAGVRRHIAFEREYLLPLLS